MSRLTVNATAAEIKNDQLERDYMKWGNPQRPLSKDAYLDHAI